MAIANLLETLLTYRLRESQLNQDIATLQGRKSLALYSMQDFRDIKAQDEQEVRDLYKALYEGDSDYQGKYADYTEIPDYELEMDKIAAIYQQHEEEIAVWEQAINDQITIDTTELEMIQAYKESTEKKLESNINDDFNYGQGK